MLLYVYVRLRTDAYVLLRAVQLLYPPSGFVFVLVCTDLCYLLTKYKNIDILYSVIMVPKFSFMVSFGVITMVSVSVVLIVLMDR